jgi:outer membrane immunogenic protein
MTNQIDFEVTPAAKQSIRRFGTALLFALIAAVPAAAQQFSRGAALDSPVIAVTYDAERAKVAGTGGGGFWLQGGGVDAAMSFFKGLGIAASLEGGHASNLQPGINLSKLTYLAGPRYTFSLSGLQVFGEGLFGMTHGFDGSFPTSGGLTPTANSYAMQFGGGADFMLARGFGVRVLEVDYVRTGVPNDGANSQNDLRLAFGLSYHFLRK